MARLTIQVMTYPNDDGYGTVHGQPYGAPQQPTYPPQSGYQPAYGQPAYQGPPPSNGNGGGVNIALVALVGVLLAALVGVLTWWFTTRGDDKPVAGTEVTTVIVDGQATTVTVPIAGSASAGLPGDAKPCPGAPGLATVHGRKTSCEFAASVRDAYISSGPRGGTRVVYGWAPTQQASVPMTCSEYGGDESIIVCRGGTQSIVYLY